MPNLNVLRKPLALHSTRPMTGFLRNGYCEVPPSDSGNHSVAAIVSDEFLDFSASRGNDLRIAGLTGGCMSYQSCFLPEMKQTGPLTATSRIVLAATSEKALDKVGLDDLKAFAVDKEESS